MEDDSFFVGSIFEQRKHLNSGIIGGIIILFFVAGVAIVGPPQRFGDIVYCVG